MLCLEFVVLASSEASLLGATAPVLKLLVLLTRVALLVSFNHVGILSGVSPAIVCGLLNLSDLVSILIN